MIFKIAFRNAFRQKRRTLLTALTMFGGFTLAAISIGWSDGTYSDIINMFTRNRLGHIQIHKEGYLDRPSLYATINKPDQTGALIESLKDVESWTPRLYSPALASIEEKSTAVQVIGIDLERENRATGFQKKIIKGKSFSLFPSHEAILGKGLSEVLQASIGDEAVIVSQAADGSIANDLFRVVGILESADTMHDRTAFYIPLKEAQGLFVLDGKIHEIAIIIHDLDQVKRVTEVLRTKLDASGFSDYAVHPWQEFARSFYQAMKVDQEGMWIMIFVIILIVAIGVLNTVLMSVLERTREYGLLKAMGTRPSLIFSQVLLEISIIAFFSCLIGALLSFLINTWLSQHGIHLPFSFTYGGVEFKAMYSEINIRSFLIPALTVFLSAALISIFPALRAARIRPSKAMRIH